MEFLALCTAFMEGCYEFLFIEYPGLGIPIISVLIGFLVMDVILSTVQIIFGVSDDSGSFEVTTVQRHFHRSPSGKVKTYYKSR